MDAFLIAFKNVIIFVLLAIPGYALVRLKLLKKENSVALSNILIYIGMPFLVVSSLAKISFNSTTLVCIGISVLIGIAYHFFLIFVSKFVAGNKSGGDNKAITRFCITFSNNGFLGIPLAIAIFGSDSLVTTCVIVINIFTNIIMGSFGVSLVSKEKNSLFVKKIIFNPLIIAFIIGIIINLVGVKDVVPEIITFSQYLSNIVTPLSMLVIGMKLADISFASIFKNKKMYYVSFMKLIVVPVFIVGILLLFRQFISIQSDLIIGAFIAFAMPTAGLAPVFAGMYDCDSENAVCYTLGSTILSILTISILYLALVQVL